MRARIALAVENIPVIIREIDLRNKARQFLAVSPKGTVPVLVFPSGKVIDESLEIVDFAIPAQQNTEEIESLLHQLSNAVIPALHRFKYATRYEDVNIEDEKEVICQFFERLDRLLKHSPYLLTTHLAKADVTLLPFVRQIYKIDTAWFDQLSYERVKRWLYHFLHSELHSFIMRKYPVWHPEPPR